MGPRPPLGSPVEESEFPSGCAATGSRSKNSAPRAPALPERRAGGRPGGDAIGLSVEEGAALYDDADGFQNSGPTPCSELVVRVLLLLLVPTTAASATLVVLRDDGRADALDLLLLLLDLLRLRLGVRIEPGLAVLDGVHDLLLLLVVQLLAQSLVVPGALGGVAHRMEVAVEGVLRVDPLLHLLVLVRVLLRLLDHLLDLVLREPALVVGDGDLLGLPGALVLRAHIQYAVRVNLEGDLDLGWPRGAGGIP